MEATPSLVPVERRCCDIASHVSCAPHAYSGRLPTHLILNNWILFDNACDTIITIGIQRSLSSQTNIEPFTRRQWHLR